MNVILGSGLAGLSTSYHLGHEHCLLLEKEAHACGHVHTEVRDGFTWDEGPHVSFTRNDYVKRLFEQGVRGEFIELAVRNRNYYRGHWIEHPAQSNLYQVPEPLRSQCLQSFLDQRTAPQKSASQPANYRDWLNLVFGKVFADTFPAPYTRKYWTVEPEQLTTDWVGSRMFHPEIEDVVRGAKGPLGRQTHYITGARYPKHGGYEAFIQGIAKGARIEFGHEVEAVDLRARKVFVSRGRTIGYDRLINTLPLPVFVRRCVQATAEVLEAADQLQCSQLLLVNVAAPHPTRIEGHWFYVYDQDKLATRINCTEQLSSNNAPPHHTGVQVEVYRSPREGNFMPAKAVAAKVVDELVEMGFIDASCRERLRVHTVWVPWANVIFDHQRRVAMNAMLDWLAQYGLAREAEDLSSAERWDSPESLDRQARLFLAGRFGQWKYFWTDDCVLRGAKLAGRI